MLKLKTKTKKINQKPKIKMNPKIYTRMMTQVYDCVTCQYNFILLKQLVSEN